MLDTIFQPISFKRGRAMPNRFMLAALTNMQSHADGTLSDDEYHWLTLRSKGGFGLTMTCAAAASPGGQAWPGQLGLFDDKHLAGMKRLADGIKAENSLAMAQLHHGGLRADAKLSGLDLVAPSDHPKSGARALSIDEVEALIEDFAQSARRCEEAGFDGVELHGAHSYLICQFLSPQYNRRDDVYGGSLDNRARFLRAIIDRTRAITSPQFTLGVRLSPERFGLQTAEMMTLAEDLMAEGALDFVDMSFWDCFKEPEEEAFKGKALIDWFAAIPRHGTLLGVSGKIRTPQDVAEAYNRGGDFIILGRAGIIHHDFPNQMMADPAFSPMPNPVPADHLRAEGLSETFVNYMRTWQGFVAS